MLDNDYDILGVDRDADLEVVKRKYDILMKRSIHDAEVDVDGITGAYDRIIKENTRDYFNPDAELLEAKGINKKKVRNYIYQNKLRLGIIIWAAICLLLIMYILIFQPGNISLTPDMVPF
ncbi:MAG: hypothetical protein R6W99_07940 [Clostridia bacterium]